MHFKIYWNISLTSSKDNISATIMHGKNYSVKMLIVVIVTVLFNVIWFIPLLLHGGAAFPWAAILISLSSAGQVVVPEELRFPHACCVGIASQTSLSLFNPSERWQQVSISVTSLAIDGEKVRRIQNSDWYTNLVSKRVRMQWEWVLLQKTRALAGLEYTRIPALYTKENSQEVELIFLDFCVIKRT